MAYSDVIRAWVIGYLSTQTSAQNQAKTKLEAQRAVTVADAVEDGAVARVARSITRILTRVEGWLSHKQLRTRLAARDRGYFDTALEHLLAAGQVQPETTQRGTQYRAVRGGNGAQ